MKTIVLLGFALCALGAANKMVLINSGGKVTLECGVNTFASQLEWRHGDDRILVQGTTGFQRKGTVEIVQRAKLKMDTKLEIDGVKEQDAGKFTCTADWIPREQTLLVVTVWVSPSHELQLGSEATLHCGVKGLDQDPALQWLRPDGSPHSGSLKSVARSDAGTWQCTFSHGGETFKQNLIIKVQEPAREPAPFPTRGPKDEVSPTCLDCVRSAVPTSAPVLLLGLSLWVWVAVGLGFLVLVLLVVIVIVLCNRIKRKKRKFQAMKNGLKLKPKKYCQCNCPAAAAKTQQGRRREKQRAPPLQPLLMP